ncbi:hypothetical protein BCR42DRAFT_372388 [Absidia repens]|uniref:SMP-LTD domain-containing protein n=1 Tax=Absidia repens TaxID=90262 RepID=A0A1X2ILZ3_9FUNG|nr:hypothetical protein BCR42DRAFT_372388 [Absidia repens]
MDWIIGILCYFTGAFTFIPLALWILHLYMAFPQAPSSTVHSVAQEVDVTTCHNYGTKKGWIRLSSNYQPKSPTMGKKKQQSKQSGEGYGVLKQGILKVYSNEMQQLCEWIIDLNHYDVSIYPSGRQEHTLFSRSVALRLQRKQSAPTNDQSSTTTTTPMTIHDNTIYFSCSRSVDKEDWYFAFVSVNNTFPNARRAIPFDPMAVASLITFVSKEKHEESDTTTDPPQQRIPWFNAILGRTFLGIYKTERLQHFVFETLAKKTKKMKSFGDIQVRSVDLGHTIPFFTNPTLVALHPDGTLVLDAQVEYNGGFKVVVEASVGGTFSIRVPLLLSLTLRSLSGTIRFKIKPPPSNRYWIGFCTMPTMKWSIVPAVSNCNVKISMVTRIIEHKIRRMMTENMVLPNMEDIPFAKSDGWGGLFHGPMEDPTNSGGGSSSSSGIIGHSPMDTASNDDDMDSTLQQSFIINNSNDNDSSSASIDSQSASSSSGRWSKFFTTRRRKNTSSSITPSLSTSTSEHIIDKAKDKSQPSNDQQTNNTGAETTKMDSDPDDVGSYNNDDTKKDIDKDLDKNGTDDVEDSRIKHSDSTMAGPYQLSPPGTASTLVQLSASTSLTTTDSVEVTAAGARGDLSKDEDNRSITSTKSSKRKRIYNAAGYIFSKGKGLANDFREHRQQDSQLSKKQPSSEPSQDLRRRYNENTPPRHTSTVSTLSSPSLSSTTAEYTLASSTATAITSSSSLRKESIPPPHMIHSDAISLSTQANSYSGSTIPTTPSQNQQQQVADDDKKPQLPPRPGRRSITPPLSTSTSSSQQQQSELEGLETMAHSDSPRSSNASDDQEQPEKSMDGDNHNGNSTLSSISKTTLISNTHHGYQT